MSIKIEKISNALVITDTVTSKTLVDCPTRLVYYEVEELENNNNIRLMNIDQDMGEVIHKRFTTYPISANVVDTGGTPYTASSWKTFARVNLGG